ncbi:uncharacterized protein LOC132050047 isoform X3 [Lycium ferocissimum]|uniref:uncharacterized protein LOC132050047 isoform X3 n=1 Tax=Lycium ferocissimum TaxID=112874 RepID=UPI002815064A|nr:uncharacterized protein LOC132050047 isoform X3 [Lycium ferocissimum]
MGFLRYTLHLIDFLAWSVLALGYPLCASIQAIEAGSRYHMRKLVTYWTIFSSISLFEHVLEKLIEWVPLWPYIKLITICWLVIPQFNGACYLYQNLIRLCFPVKLHDSIRQFDDSCYVYQRLLYLCLSVNLQTVTDWFNKPMKDPSLKNETFLAVAERYLEENGSDALEKLIANKSKDYISDHHAEEIKPTDASAEEGALTPNQTERERSGPVWEDITVMENMAKHEAAEPKQENPIQIEKKTTGVLVKEMVIPANAEEIKLPNIISSKQVQTEWTCAVCQMTTTSEQNLKSHLNGRKHKAKCEGLKTCMQTAKREGSSPVTTKSNELNQEQVKHAAAAGLKHGANEAAEPKKRECEGSHPVWEDIKVMEHMAKHEAAETKQGYPIQIEKKTTGVQVKEMTVPADAEEIKLPGIISSKQVQTEWTCAVCQVTATSEQILKSHLNGRKHKAKCEGLKTCKQTAKSEGSSPVTTKSNQLNQEKVKHEAAARSEHIANEAAEPKQVKSLKETPIQIEKKTTAVQIKETALPADAEEIKLPETNSVKKVQTEWTCAVCQVTTKSEHDLKCHLLGRRHRENCEVLKTFKKTAKTERNPPFTSNMPDKLKKEQVKHAISTQRKHSTNEKPKEKVQLGATGQHQKQKQVKNAGGATHNSKLWCRFCNIRCPGEIDMASHLNGRKHLAKLQETMSFTGGTWALDYANMHFYQGI